MNKILALLASLTLAFSLTGCMQEKTPEQQKILDDNQPKVIEYYTEKYGQGYTVEKSTFKTQIDSHLSLQYKTEAGYYKMSDGNTVIYDYNAGILYDNKQNDEINAALKAYVEDVVNTAHLTSVRKSSGALVLSDRYYTEFFDSSRAADAAYIKTFLDSQSFNDDLTLNLEIEANTVKSIDLANAQQIYNKLNSDGIYKEIKISTVKDFEDRDFHGLIIDNGKIENKGYYLPLSFDGIELKLMLEYDSRWGDDFEFSPENFLIERAPITAEELKETYIELYAGDLIDAGEKYLGKTFDPSTIEIEGVIYKITLSDLLKDYLSAHYSDSIKVKILESSEPNIDIINFDKGFNELRGESYLFVGKYGMNGIVISDSDSLKSGLFNLLKDGLAKAGTSFEELISKAQLPEVNI